MDLQKQKRILIIEDELNVVNLLQINLETEGYEVFTAYNGQEGLEQIKANHFDLAICDVMMPELDGFELCRIVRDDQSIDVLPFIFLTAKSDIPEKIDGFNAGADDYMTKPFHIDELLARVNAILNRVDRIREDSQDSFRITSQDLNRLSALGVLAASIAHEVRNQLTSVVNSAEMLRLTKDEPRREKYTDVVVSQIDRINNMVCSMLNFARRKDAVREVHSIESIIDEVQDLTQPRLVIQSGEMILKVPKGLPNVAVDRQQICQVFINLIINALQAMDENGCIEISVEQVDQNVVVQFSDNGPGIPQEILSTIFEPFVSTKLQSGGIGLGLYISKEIIESHGGSILVNSTEGKGTCFTIQLPVFKKDAAGSAEGDSLASSDLTSMQ